MNKTITASASLVLTQLDVLNEKPLVARREGHPFWAEGNLTVQINCDGREVTVTGVYGAFIDTDGMVSFEDPTLSDPCSWEENAYHELDLDMARLTEILGAGYTVEDESDLRDELLEAMKGITAENVVRQCEIPTLEMELRHFSSKASKALIALRDEKAAFRVWTKGRSGERQAELTIRPDHATAHAHLRSRNIDLHIKVRGIGIAEFDELVKARKLRPEHRSSSNYYLLDAPHYPRQ